MRKRFAARIFACVMTAATIMTAMPAEVYAEEFDLDLDWDEVDEDDGYDDYGSDQDQEVKEEYNYLDSQMRASWGQVTKGDEVEFQQVAFCNYGSQKHMFNITLTDPDMWEVVYPKTNIITPGDDGIIYVAVRPKLSSSKFGTGDYSSTIYMNGFDSDNEEITCTVGVNLYVSVYEKAQPWVSNVTVSPSSISMGKGTSYNFTADVTCGDGASGAVDWSVNGNNSGSTSISSSGCLTIGADETSSNIQVVATSSQDRSCRGTASVNISKSQYSVALQTSPANGGTAAGGGTYSDGDTVTLVASPATGFSFTGWYDQNNNLLCNSTQYIFTASQNRTVVAKFTQNSVYVMVGKNLDQGGTVSNSAYIQSGGEYTLKAVPNQGYSFAGWYEGNNRISDSATCTVKGITSYREFMAVFVQSAYNVQITASPSDGGKVSGAGSYTKGTNAVITAEPANGYEFIGWLCNNNLLSNSKSCTIQSIDRDYNLVAVFQKANAVTYAIASSTGTGSGTISPLGTVKVEKGKNMVYAISPNADYHIKDVKVDGTSIGAVTSYTFINVQGEHTIVADFEKNATTAAAENAAKTSASSTNAATKTGASNASSTAAKTGTSNTASSKQTYDEETGNTAVVTTEPTGDAVVVADTEETQEVTMLTGTLQDMNITSEEAGAMIDSGNDRALMENALLRGDLKVTTRNMYADTVTESAAASYYDLANFPNFSDVMDSVLSKDEKLDLFAGSEVVTSLTVCSLDDEVDPADQAVFEQKTGSSVTIGSYFDVRLIVENYGVPKLVTDLSQPMTVVMNVTPEMKASGKEYCVMRLHGGSFDILPDEDSDPDTLTFTTDKMSVFAMGYYNSSNTGSVTTGNLTQDTTANAKGNTASSAASQKNNYNTVLYIMFGVIIAGVGVITGVAIAAGKRKRRHHRRK